MKGKQKLIFFNLRGERIEVKSSITMGELNNWKKDGLLIPLLVKQEN